MLRLICSILFTFSVFSSFAQGSWNIGYIKVDSLNKTHIGRIIRIDFKTPQTHRDTSIARLIRSYVGIKDTGFINLDTMLIAVAERRKIYADHGNFNDQFLECLNCKGTSFRIYDAKILDVDAQSIQFRIEIEQVNEGAENSKFSKLVVIEKTRLDGVLYEL